MIASRCSACLWWDREHHSLAGVLSNYGYCRKHYPVVYLHDGRYYGSWPLVDQNDLCGEFKPERREGQDGLSN